MGGVYHPPETCFFSTAWEIREALYCALNPSHRSDSESGVV